MAGFSGPNRCPMLADFSASAAFPGSHTSAAAKFPPDSAMIGAIVLTLRHRTGVKRQNVLEQMYRDPKTAIVMKDVKPGQGL